MSTPSPAKLQLALPSDIASMTLPQVHSWCQENWNVIEEEQLTVT
jgi:hypothetical protein